MLESHDEALMQGKVRDVLQEYDNSIDDLKRELETCKEEQNDIRCKLYTLQDESKTSCDAMYRHISSIHLENGCGNSTNTQSKIVTNLQQQIVALQKEKDSAVELWQMSMGAIDALELEIKARSDTKDAKLYENELRKVQRSYTDVINALQEQVLEARKKYSQQESMWMTSKEATETLRREKEEAVKRFEEFQQSAQRKDRESQQRIHLLTEELDSVKAQIETLKYLKSDLEKSLSESRKIAVTLSAKNEETQCKMLEALDLAESAVVEKDKVLQREAEIAKQKAALTDRLTSIEDKYAMRMHDEIARLKETHEQITRQYLLEIKELKSDLREKVTVLDRSQRESKLAEEELERVRRDSENLLEKCTAKIASLEQALEHADARLETTEMRYESETRKLRERIVSLEEQLADLKERLRLINGKLPDREMKDAIDGYVNMETRLTQATTDKEALARELESLRSTYSREICKRESQRLALETKICELESTLQSTSRGMTGNKLCANADVNPVGISLESHADTMKKSTLHVRFNDLEQDWQRQLIEQLRKEQEQCDNKIKMMTQHVMSVQNLNRQYKDEVTFLTSRFKVKSKELHRKIHSLKNEKEELQKALLACRQQFAQYKSDTVHSYVQGPKSS